MAQFFYEQVTARRRIRFALAIEWSQSLPAEGGNHPSSVHRRSQARFAQRSRMMIAIAGLLSASCGTYLYAAAPAQSGSIRIELPATKPMASADARLTAATRPVALSARKRHTLDERPRDIATAAPAILAQPLAIDRLDAVEAAIHTAISTNVAQRWAAGGFSGYAVAGAPSLQDTSGCRRVAVSIEAEGVPGRVAGSDWCLTRGGRWARAVLDATFDQIGRETPVDRPEPTKVVQIGTEVEG